MALPTYKGIIFAKIIRLGQELSARRKVRLQMKKDRFWGGNGASANIPNTGREGSRAGSESAVGQPQPQAPQRVAQQKSAPAPQMSVFEGDLLDSSDYSNGAAGNGQAAGRAPQFSEQFSERGGSRGSTVSSEQLYSIDEDSSGVPVPQSLNRDQLAARREAAVQEKVKEALEFKQELDENQRKEAQELDEAKAKHDKNLTA